MLLNSIGRRDGQHWEIFSIPSYKTVGQRNANRPQESPSLILPFYLWANPAGPSPKRPFFAVQFRGSQCIVEFMRDWSARSWVTGLVSLGAIWILYPLLLPIVFGALFALLLDPMVAWVERRRLRRLAATLLVTSAITLLLLIPSSFGLFVVIRAAVAELQGLREMGAPAALEHFLQSPFIQNSRRFLESNFGLETEQMVLALKEIASTLGMRIANGAGNLASQLPGFGISMGVSVIALFFFLLDGPRWVTDIRRGSVFSKPETDRLLAKLAGLCRSVILASLVTSAVQGIVALAAFSSAGVPQAVLWAALVFFLAFVPLIGASPVTFGVAIWQIVSQGPWVGGFLLLVAGLISISDNFIRPIFLKGAGNLHPMVGFMGVFGGLQTLGFSGLFVGPIILGLLIELLQIGLERKWTVSSTED